MTFTIVSTIRPPFGGAKKALITGAFLLWDSACRVGATAINANVIIIYFRMVMFYQNYHSLPVTHPLVTGADLPIP
jgi:hypothetical protein